VAVGQKKSSKKLISISEGLNLLPEKMLWATRFKLSYVYNISI